MAKISKGSTGEFRSDEVDKDFFKIGQYAEDDDPKEDVVDIMNPVF